jgi:hypothetical protein
MAGRFGTASRQELLSIEIMEESRGDSELREDVGHVGEHEKRPTTMEISFSCYPFMSRSGKKKNG